MLNEKSVIIKEREQSVLLNNKRVNTTIDCETNSVSGVVSQRACVYCGARVVLNPITDAAHIVHGPIGCASYTWDIRGSLSSGSESYRNSFSTDLREEDIIFGGEKKLTGAIDEIVKREKPNIIFVYSTCVVGVIGDDIEAICKKAEENHNIKVIPVKSSGFAGNKKDGYRAACKAILNLMGNKAGDYKEEKSLNFLGDFNLAAESWIIKNYLQQLGIKIRTCITGDSSSKSLKDAKYASLNIVQCAGSITFLAKEMKKRYDIPFEKVRFFGVEDTIRSLKKIVYTIGDEETLIRLDKFISQKKEVTLKEIDKYRKKVQGKKVALYVGGGFKGISLIKQFNELGIETVIVGTQTGSKEEYEQFKELTNAGTVILDDSNPSELEYFIKEKKADILVGGVKERPLAYKLGLAFIDHNHERKHPLCGFEGAINFAKEVDLTVNSPVWDYIRKE
jgi:nitrogenase molybdenum-cofactor synthesis protein NifE